MALLLPSAAEVGSEGTLAFEAFAINIEETKHRLIKQNWKETSEETS
jgi:hypothetical protein